MLIPESGSKEGRFAKMLVEVNLTQPLIRATTIYFEGEKRWVTFRYEQLPAFCYYCGRLGHSERNCGKKIMDSKNLKLQEGQYREWLRAEMAGLVLKGEILLKNCYLMQSILEGMEMRVGLIIRFGFWIFSLFGSIYSI